MILDTDYTQYASVWTCKEFRMMGIILRREFGWVLGREERLSEEVFKKAKHAMQKFGIRTDKLEITDRSLCS